MPIVNPPTIVMNKVEKMPTAGRYADQAEAIYAELSTAGSPMLVATHTVRSSLETLALHLRKTGQVKANVVTVGRDGDGQPNKFALYAEYTPAQEAE